MAAHEISRRVAGLTTEACFMVKEWERYTSIAAAAHEMMRHAAKLAEEAREIEKGGDTVLRKPHHPNGTILEKRKLIEKPTKPQEFCGETGSSEAGWKGRGVSMVHG